LPEGNRTKLVQDGYSTGTLHGMELSGNFAALTARTFWGLEFSGRRQACHLGKSVNFPFGHILIKRSTPGITTSSCSSYFRPPSNGRWRAGNCVAH